MTVDEFLKTFGPPAREFYQKKGLFASITLAQAALETGWAKFVPRDKYTGKYSYNLFGIKGIGPAGTVTSETKEYINGIYKNIDGKFKAYPNWYQSIEDHHNKLFEPRYKPVLAAKTYQGAAEQLQICGYATDPKYAWKLIKIIEANNLQQFDVKGKDSELEKAVRVLEKHGIINSPDFWIENAVTGKTVPGEFAAALIYKTAAALNKK